MPDRRPRFPFQFPSQGAGPLGRPLRAGPSPTPWMEDADFAAFERGADGLGGVNPPPTGFEHMVVRAGDPPARPEHLIVRPGDPPARMVLLGAEGGSPSQARQPEGSPSSRDAWAEEDDFAAFEQAVDAMQKTNGVYRKPVFTAADEALGGGHAWRPVNDPTDARDTTQPVLYPVQSPQGDTVKKPTLPPELHTPETAEFIKDRAAAGLRAQLFGDLRPMIKLFEKYPGAKYDFADGVKDKMGAKRNTAGQLVGGSSLSREVIGDLTVKGMAGATRDEKSAFKTFRGNSPITPQQARQAASAIRRTGGAQGEVLAQELEAKALEAERRRGRQP